MLNKRFQYLFKLVKVTYSLSRYTQMISVNISGFAGTSIAEAWGMRVKNKTTTLCWTKKYEQIHSLSDQVLAVDNWMLL